MADQPIRPDGDERVQHKTAVLNGITYHYLYAVPESGTWTDTVFLIHGWPDLALGWRYQIPLLVSLGLRVVAPDMMGYGGTDAPEVPPNTISLYGCKRAADDIACLAEIVGAQNIILGGHDWGGVVVWRTALWYPDLVSHVFSVCTPYTAPNKQFFSIEQLVKGPLPQFAYQLHLASGEVEKSVYDETTIRQFLKGIYGATGPNGEPAFEPYRGVIKENLAKVGESKILNGEVLDHYVAQYVRHGIHPTLNWYRQRRTNWEEDQALLDETTITQPVLFIQAAHDSVLKPEMSRGMEKLIPKLTRAEVDASHWALTQKPEEVNTLIRQWLEKEGLVKTKSAL
ncbi:alpha/beta-hydrolase [Didymella exigua CBS 183.55]|uniref:Alpha/beta-hydrolase n=1 Tax=Didymella exigua CBS 183.55 TaxID=1150837 RepID=A0A6A5RDH0_9PLEO|nr:alpha/beta-hydrolase [Didymella exigua CBS 183.55]KAF1925722.1 alpha/beta-hydrolase [Didymella exigua CBS 183.55]